MGLVTNIAAYAPTLKSVSPSIHTLLQRMTAVWCPRSCSGSKGCGTETSSDDEPRAKRSCVREGGSRGRRGKRGVNRRRGGRCQDEDRGGCDDGGDGGRGGSGSGAGRSRGTRARGSRRSRGRRGGTRGGSQPTNRGGGDGRGGGGGADKGAQPTERYFTNVTEFLALFCIIDIRTCKLNRSSL